MDNLERIEALLRLPLTPISRKAVNLEYRIEKLKKKFLPATAGKAHNHN